MSKKIAVLAGGISAEKEISKRSGQNVYEALKNAGFIVEIFDPSDKSFSFEQLTSFDVIYPIMHGKQGEDGIIQGILEFKNIPYVGSNVLTSAITMDKQVTKSLFQSIGILCPNGFETTQHIDEIYNKIETIGFPVFIKPVSEGSSVGTLILHSKEEMLSLLPDHLKLFPNSLVEKFISGREMTIGAFHSKGKLHILPVLELKPKAEFYNFETKYTAGMTEFILPAPIDDEILNKIHKDIAKITEYFKLRDCFRVDFILENNTPIYLEINTAPGMTVTSDIPAMLNAAGISMSSFVEDMIHNALERKICE